MGCFFFRWTIFTLQQVIWVKWVSMVGAVACRSRAWRKTLPCFCTQKTTWVCSSSSSKQIFTAPAMNSRVLWACKHRLHFYSWWSQNFCWRDDHQITGGSSCCYLRLAFQLKTGGMKSVLWAPIRKQAKNKNLVIFHLSQFGDLYYGVSKQIVRSTSPNSLQRCDGNLCWKKPIPSLKHHLVANPEISHASECGWDEVWPFLMRWKAVHCSLQGALKDRPEVVYFYWV